LKKFIAYILSFYILLSAVVPCSFFDTCEEEQDHPEQTSRPFRLTDCDNCSPFSICASAHGFVVNHQRVSLKMPIAFIEKPSYTNYHMVLKAGYQAAFFQPPKVA
jgi:hypothetical protein